MTAAMFSNMSLLRARVQVGRDKHLGFVIWHDVRGRNRCFYRPFQRSNSSSPNRSSLIPDLATNN